MTTTTNSQTCCSNARVAAGVAAIVGALLIMGWMNWLLTSKTTPADVSVKRAGERAKNLAEVRAAEHQVVTTYDFSGPMVRVPVDRAMELTVREWQNPAAAKSNLVWRVKKATAPPEYE